MQGIVDKKGPFILIFLKKIYNVASMVCVIEFVSHKRVFEETSI